jgi:hypothetical protein
VAVFDADGESLVSGADLAVAIVDEIETCITVSTSAWPASAATVLPYGGIAQLLERAVHAEATRPSDSDAMSTVFLLLQTDPGRAGDAAAFLRGRDSVADVAATSGPFDVIVTADVSDSAGLEHVVGECRRAPGLVRLSCCHTTQR